MAKITPDDNNQPHVAVRTPAATGSVHLHGATVTGWAPPKHQPVLWTSSKSLFDGHNPIRGGVPICTPWFGAHPTDTDAPAHGLARTAAWTLDHAGLSEEETLLGLGLELPGLKFAYGVLMGHGLKLVLEITNTGDTPRRVEAALHTYLAVSDARKVTITGLEQTSYIDKVNGASVVPATGEPIAFTGETDRVYTDTDHDVVLHDPGLDRTITVSKDGGLSTIIWNPWIDKAARMADFGDDEWTGMCCIESAAVGDDAWTLEPGETRALAATIAVQSTD